MSKTGAAILTIDAGTGDCRAIAFSAEGKVIASEKTEWTYGRTDIPDALAFEPDACFDSVCGLIRKVSEKLGTRRVEAVTVTSQRDGMAYLDASGRELYCAPNMDLRGKAVLKELEPCRNEILNETGLPIHPMFGLPRFLWHKRRAPEIYGRIDRVLMLCDWLAYRLCGEKRSERAAANSSQMFSIRQGAYSAKLMDLVGLRNDVFPEECAPDDVIGALTPEAASKIGLPSGIPVLIGGSDAHCGIAGMGLFREGETAVIAGTTTPVVTLCDRPIIDLSGNLFSGCTAVSGVWGVESNAGSTGLSLRWTRDIMRAGEDAFSGMAADAERVPAGSDGMMAYIGTTIPDEAGGMNYGGFLFPVPWNISDFTRAHFFRAAMETNAFAVRANLPALAAAGAKPPKTLHLCGGQSKSPFFSQMLADVTGIPVQTYADPECTALGAALLAAGGAGLFSSAADAAGAFVRPSVRYLPDARESDLYQNIYDNWLKLRSHLDLYR